MMGLCLVLFVALCARVALIVYGEFHDSQHDVKYTDIDYIVFTDAASYVSDGASPYNRTTYRYTPLLAFAMVPNVTLCRSFGKYLFSLCDLLVAVIIYNIVQGQLLLGKCSSNDDRRMGPLFCAIFWLFNPITIAISSRGSAESLVVLPVLAVLLCLAWKRCFFAGLFFGFMSKNQSNASAGHLWFSVHFKLYPVIYGPALYLYLNLPHHDGRVEERRGRPNILPSTQSFLFFLAAFCSFSTATLLCYCLYGFEFLEQTYFYHFRRSDTKHNFSPFFYLLYLAERTNYRAIIGRLVSFPQIFVIGLTTIQYFRSLHLCLFVQTFMFVSFNKVCTSQYFVWYLAILPLLFPHLRISRWKLVSMFLTWLIAQGLWLYPAYLLEFEGHNTFIWIWIASLLFLVVNVATCRTLILSHDNYFTCPTTQAIDESTSAPVPPAVPTENPHPQPPPPHGIPSYATTYCATPPPPYFNATTLHHTAHGPQHLQGQTILLTGPGNRPPGTTFIVTEVDALNRNQQQQGSVMYGFMVGFLICCCVLCAISILITAFQKSQCASYDASACIAAESCFWDRNHCELRAHHHHN